MNTETQVNPAVKTPEDAVPQAEQVERTRSGLAFQPHVDILETADELLLVADLPGATAEDIDVHFEKGQLRLYAKVFDRTQRGTPYLLREYGVGDFYRTFKVNEAIDPARIAAEYRQGVLTLHLPKSEAVKARKIAVNAMV